MQVYLLYLPFQYLAYRRGQHASIQHRRPPSSPAKTRLTSLASHLHRVRSFKIAMAHGFRGV
ncbi:hypothetical protein NEOLEDRAFT_543606 [Neolentinus lepideus HHB14362 ss-1]|uniref:Uncharacterized protein n=1 Tax=Neolentinus lepideus HHB14362 ss-1 TaxID=1314782 RepID=A0A165R7D8_9AGAM|nr:hypothetical protein NEOLEDRAFT_543606 [Neolentinus lepideus HHB14362 ss-1]